MRESTEQGNGYTILRRGQPRPCVFCAHTSGARSLPFVPAAGRMADAVSPWLHRAGTAWTIRGKQGAWRLGRQPAPCSCRAGCGEKCLTPGQGTRIIGLLLRPCPEPRLRRHSAYKPAPAFRQSGWSRAGRPSQERYSQEKIFLRNAKEMHKNLYFLH